MKNFGKKWRELRARFTLPVAKKYQRSPINGFIGKFLGQK
jgi:hypothetical protein